MSVLLRAKDLIFHRGANLVLNSVSLTVRTGRMVGLIGPNGAGKSTLLQILANLLSAQSGTLELKGTPIAQIPADRLARHLSYLPQFAECHWPMSAYNVVMLGRIPHQGWWGSPSPNDHQLVKSSMLRTGSLEFSDRPISQLSGGERARVLMARALAVNADVLVADEPVTSLDPFHQLHIMEVLRQSARGGIAVVVVMHDLTLAARFCDDLLLLHQGQLVAGGSPRAVLSKENLSQVYGVDAFRSRFEKHHVIVPWNRINASHSEPM